MLAAFVLGIMFKKASSSGVTLGVVSGITLNLVLWKWFPGVSWLWWNVTGCLSAIAIGYLWSLGFPHKGAVETYKKPDSPRGGG